MANICPITLQEMSDPVIDREGNSYERSAIEQWLRTNSYSPITRNPMSIRDLVPNRALRPESSPAPTQVIQQLPAPAAELPNGKSYVLVLDTSGSMDSDCSLVSESGEKDGLTRMDLLKHTVRVIITSLNPGDIISIYGFSYSITCFFQQTKIQDDTTKQTLISRINGLSSDGSTNLYEAVLKPIQDLANNPEPNTIILLTDGEPTANPIECSRYSVEVGIIKALESRLPKVIRSQHTLHVFGYGYSLMSNLLYNLATKLPNLKPGVFGFIPDASMLGTTLINIMAASRYMPENINSPTPNLTMNDLDIIDTMLCPILEKAAHLPENKAIDSLISRLEAIQHPTPFVSALLLDIKESPDPSQGQIQKALLPAYYSKWGRHYIISALSAFKQRICINFKDNAIQHFKTPEISSEQDRLADIFSGIEPPTASRRDYSSSHISRTPVNMSSYYNAAGGCFHPNSLLATPDIENPIEIKDVKKGTVLMTAEGLSQVECLLVLKYSGPIFQVSPCLGLTGFHPFKTEDQTEYFPVEYLDSLEIFQHEGYVYDIIMVNRSSVLTPDNFEVATTGHNIKSPKFSHPYFGSESIIIDIKFQALEIYDQGYIQSEKPTYIRDPATNLICFLKI